MKCKKECPEKLAFFEASLSVRCFRAIEYGLCKKWKANYLKGVVCEA